MLKILLIFLILLIPSTADAALFFNERHYQTQWCEQWHGQEEYKLEDGTRVDCLTTNYAVEFDFAKKWAESIGQSLYYGLMTGKKPAIVLIIEKPSDFIYYNRIKEICAIHGITLWYVIGPFYKTNGRPIVDHFKNFT